MKRWEIYLEILCECLMIAGMLFLIGYVLPKTLAFLWPLVAGWLIAVLAHPVLKFLHKKLKISKHIGSAAIIVVVIAGIITALYALGSKLVHEGMEFANAVPAMYHDAEQTIVAMWNTIKGRLPAWIADEVSGVTIELVSEITSYFASNESAGVIGTFAKSLTNGIIGVIVMFLSAYFFLVDWDAIHNAIARNETARWKTRVRFVWDNILGVVGGYIIAQLKLMCIIAALLFAGFLIMRLEYSLLLALLISLLDALPFFGVGTALIPWAVYEFISNHTQLAVGLLILYVICLLTRQILQPRIVGGTVGLSALSTLVLMYIGMKVAGILGFVIAVVLGMIVKRFYEQGMFDGSINRMKSRIQMLQELD
jgi:sporulation integral membrane protein YtvI